MKIKDLKELDVRTCIIWWIAGSMLLGVIILILAAS
jgi:hypothetical protein